MAIIAAHQRIADSSADVASGLLPLSSGESSYRKPLIAEEDHALMRFMERIEKSHKTTYERLTPSMESDLLTTGEAAKLCGVTSDAVLKWIKKGRFPAIRTSGGHFRIARKTLETLGYGEPDAASQPDPAPERCWEYFCRDLAPPEKCKECVVYRARIEKCYEVAELGDTIGHNRQFCRATCENCSFFRASNGLATTVLVVTSDEALVDKFTTQANAANVALRFARCGYESAMLVETFHPSVVVMDSVLPEVRDGRLADSMIQDERIPGVKLIVAQRKGDKAPPGRGASVMPAPFTVKKIERLVQDLVRSADAPWGVES